MNARIKELISSCETTTTEWYDGRGNVTSTHFDREKFAKLIVKECAGIYDKIDNGNLHMGTDKYPKALHKHFGVE